MSLFLENKINTSKFDTNLKELVGQELEKVFFQANLTGNPKIRPVHMLLACLSEEDRVNKYYTNQFFNEFGIHALTFKQILLKKVSEDNGVIVRFTGVLDDFCESSVKVLGTLEEKMQSYECDMVNEKIFLYSILCHIDDQVINILKVGDLEIEVLLKRLEEVLKISFTKQPTVEIFEKSNLILDRFDIVMQSNLRKVCDLTSQTGYHKMTLLHLFLVLVMNKNGITQKGLITQGKRPEWVIENLMDYLKKPGQISNSKVITLYENDMHRSVYNIFLKSAEIAAQDNLNTIGESQILRAIFQKESPYPLEGLADLRIKGEYLSVVAEDYKDPVMRLEPEEEEKEPVEFSYLEERLNKKIIGQSLAIKKIMPLIKRFIFGLIREGKPIGTFLFMGPSSVGKTQLAKEIAAVLFGVGEEHVIFINMGGFKNEISINRFIGAPPGYVGFGQGELTNGLRDKPNSVILLDEVEKADEKVFDVLLDLLSEGKITDPAGPVRDASHCIIIMTSNLAADRLNRIVSSYRISDLEKDNEKIKEFSQCVRTELEKFFRPEFINRIDEIIVFNSLKIENLKEITTLQLDRSIKNFRKQKKIDICFTNKEDLSEYIAWRCHTYRQEEGGRGPEKMVDSWVCNEILEHLINMDKIPDKLSVTFSRGGETLVFG